MFKITVQYYLSKVIHVDSLELGRGKRKEPENKDKLIFLLAEIFSFPS